MFREGDMTLHVCEHSAVMQALLIPDQRLGDQARIYGYVGRQAGRQAGSIVFLASCHAGMITGLWPNPLL